MDGSERVTPERIKAFRRRFRLSAKKFGALLGYSRAYIKGLEGGTVPISEPFRSRFTKLAAEMESNLKNYD